MMVMFTTLSLSAQTVEYSKFTDNLYVGINTGVEGWLHPQTINHSTFLKSMHSVSGLRVGKHITPVIGFELDVEVGMANHHKLVDHTTFGGNLMVNLNNAIHKYKGEPDRVEVVPFVGIGWHHTYGDKSMVTNNIASKFGSQVNFNMDKDKKWQINVIPSINYIMTDNGFGVMTGQPRFDANRAFVNVQVGVTYKFRNSNKTHNFTLCPYKYTTSDYERLKNMLKESDDALVAAQKTNAENNKLLLAKQKEIDSLNARQMTVVENVTMVNTVVGFEIGKTKVLPIQEASLVSLAEAVKNTDTKLNIVGYADAKTGSKARNLKLSEMRAEAVKKVLVKYGVKEENITATGMGDTVQPYSDNYMNRAVVFTTK